ncbi:glycogen synthase [bacterium]|nr:glycogen synthase [bacterium]
MKILYATFELAPYIKVGGLADVMGSLPKELSKTEGLEIAIFAPLLKSVDREKYDIKEIPNSELSLKFGYASTKFNLYMTKFPETNINVFFIENKKYFSCFDKAYPEGIDDRYEQERFIVFSRAILEYTKLINFRPDIIHANDWHTSMISVYLKSSYKNDEFFKNTKTVFSIHNLAYQGRYFDDILDFAQIDKAQVYHDKCLEQWGSLIWMKGAIYCSEKIVAVSPRYSREILTPDYGEGLDWTLNENKDKLIGILNGIDYSIYNPETDINLVKNYSSSDLGGKEECKKDILKLFALEYKKERPLIALVSRLVEQKGIDLIEGAQENLKNLNADFIILGTGEHRYEEFFKYLNSNSSNIRAILQYRADLGNKIYAGADMFLMPSRFEPCGLSQLIALKYGTIPIVRATGGLDDTIVGYPLDNSNGFKFWRYEPSDMLEAINCAINVYKDHKTWKCVQKSAMEYDYSWDKSAEKYLEVYRSLCS